MSEGRLQMLNFFPKTGTGWLSTRLFAGFVLAFAVFGLMILAGQRGGETFFSNLWLTIPFLTAVMFAIGGLIYSSISIVRDKERAIAVFIVWVIGAFVLFFMTSEILSPH